MKMQGLDWITFIADLIREEPNGRSQNLYHSDQSDRRLQAAQILCPKYVRICIVE